MASANSTADRAIEILLMFSDEQSVVNAAVIAERFKMPRSTTYRYLTSLRTNGLLVESGEAGYRLGPRILDLARIARSGYSIIHVAEPQMRKLASATGETVLLTRKDRMMLSVLECVESAQPVRISYSRGQMLPTPAAAAAKVILAYGGVKQAELVLRRKKLVKYTKNTLVNRNEILRELELVLKRGYAVNRNEVDEGLTATAAPIFEADGSVRHAVSVAAPSFRANRKQLNRNIALVREAADEITVQHSGYVSKAVRPRRAGS